jgi:flagellar FliL protein
MAKDEKDLEGDEAKAGGKKKLLIIIAAVVLLLAVGGGVALLLLGGDEPADEVAQAEQAPVAKPDPLYYEFKPQFVVNLPRGSRARMLQVKMEVMSRDQKVIDFIDHNSPMLRHHLFNLFSTQDASALYGRPGREALAKAVKAKLQSLLKAQQFKGEIEAVYFSELVLQ